MNARPAFPDPEHIADISADVNRGASALDRTGAMLAEQAKITASGYVEALDALHDRKIQRLIVDDNAFGYRIGFVFGAEALDWPLHDLLQKVLRRIDLEKRRKQTAHWTFDSGRLTELIQIKVAINERLKAAVEAHRAERAGEMEQAR